jgi:hypothetical protein
MNIKDLFGDKDVRHVLLLSFLVATFILFATKAGHSTGEVVVEYFHELAMALLVALPILVTIELFNQKRHAKREHEAMREQAIAMIKRSLPTAIWNAIENGVIRCNFFREDHHASYTLSLDTTRPVHLVVVRAVHRFVLRCGQEPNRSFIYKPEIMFAKEGADLAKFVSLKYGSTSLSKDRLETMTVRRNGHLALQAVNIDVPDVGVLVELEIQTAYVIDQPFEGVIAVVPTTSLRIDVDAPRNMTVILDALHQEDFVVEKPTAPYGYSWLQKQGLVQGQGALLRWEINEEGQNDQQQS